MKRISSLRVAPLFAVIGLSSFMACGDAGGPTSPPPPGTGPDVTLEPAKDNTLFEEGPLSNGAGQFLFAGMTVDTVSRRALVQFDVAGSAVPSGATIDSVQFVLRMDRTIVDQIDVAVHRVTADWGEAGSDAEFAEGKGIAAESGDATWLQRFFDTTPWTTPGGDFVAAPSATQIVENDVRPYTWGTTPQLVQDVQGWLDDPTNNFGWIVIADESTHTTAKRFGSREEAAPNRPKLLIYFTAP